VLNVRKLIIRIAIVYEHESTTKFFFGNDFLITNQLILTCAHHFTWNNEKVSYSKIYVCCCDPAYETFFSLVDPSNVLIEAKQIRRGLERDNLTEYDEVNCYRTDLALLELITSTTHLQVNEYFNPKLNLSSFIMKNTPISSKLYLIGYNGQLKDNDDLNPYRYLKDFENLTIDKLNLHHNVNYKLISVGHLIEESSSLNQYSTHNCSILCGSSGALMLNSMGKFAGIHIGVINSRKEKNIKCFLTKKRLTNLLALIQKHFENLFMKLFCQTFMMMKSPKIGNF